ncbi:MAG TPA: TlpA disulfide reductase family protein [Candidatus Baltobacteraceae bacterium]|nr:TlpA disulfide reductase family protein [Candidatus Baltobacteraceae bacterium]
MRPERARWWLAGVVLVALVLVGARLERHYHHHVLRTGDRLVPIQVSSLYGSAYTLSPAHRPTIINVFATWCTPCREETPGFAAAARGLRARGFDLVGIDQEESAAAVSAFAQEFALPYPVYIDTTGVTHDLLGARVIPTTILVNGDGVIVWEHAGPLTVHDLLAAISQTESNG